MLPVPGPSSPWCSLPPSPDDSVAVPKSPWGINIIKKNKKAAPRAFGVRLEECQPATENQVGPHHIAEPAGEGETELQGALEAALHLVLQTQRGKLGEGAAELRQGLKSLANAPSQTRARLRPQTGGSEGLLSPYRVSGSSWALYCPHLGLSTSSGSLVENAALTLPNNPALPVSPACPPDRGCMLSHRGGTGAGVHGHLPSARQQCSGVQPAGAAQPWAQ